MTKTNVPIGSSILKGYSGGSGWAIRVDEKLFNHMFCKPRKKDAIKKQLINPN